MVCVHIYNSTTAVSLTTIFDDSVAFETFSSSVVVEGTAAGAVATDDELITPSTPLLGGWVDKLTLGTAPYCTHPCRKE